MSQIVVTQGTTGTPRLFTIDDEDIDIAGSTIQGSLLNIETKEKKLITGVLQVNDNKSFEWYFGSNDVNEPGTYELQFSFTQANGKIDFSNRSTFIVTTKV